MKLKPRKQIKPILRFLWPTQGNTR